MFDSDRFRITVLMRYVLFWDITQRRFGTIYRSQLNVIINS